MCIYIYVYGYILIYIYMYTIVYMYMCLIYIVQYILLDGWETPSSSKQLPIE